MFEPGGRRPPAVRGCQGKDSAMLMRFEPLREFDRITEEMLAQHRVH